MWRRLLEKLVRKVRGFIYNHTKWRPKPGSIFFSPSRAIMTSLREVDKK